MKYSAEDYRNAFNSLLNEGIGEEKLISGLAKAIVQNGDVSRADKIIRSIEDGMIKNKGERRVVCEVAREINPSLEKEIKHSLKQNDHVEFVVNPELVAGTRITFDGEYQLDKSFRQKLKKCFAIN